MFRTFVALHFSVTRCNIKQDISIMQENKQEKSPIKQKILLYLDSIGVSQYDFYKKTGVTRGVLGQNNGISEDNLSRFLAYYPEVNPIWLLTGQGEMLLKEQPSTPVEIPASDNNEASVYYKMYKEKDEEVKAQAKEIGALEQKVKTLEEKILGLQQDSRPDLVSDTSKASDGSTRTRRSGVAGLESARFAEQP